MRAAAAAAAAPGDFAADAAPATAPSMHHRGGRSSSTAIPAADDAVDNIEPTNRENNTRRDSRSPCSLSVENLNPHAVAQSTLPQDVDHRLEDTGNNKPYPDHQAALRRPNGSKHNLHPSDSSSTTSTQPVLVRSYPSNQLRQNTPSMKRKSKPTTAANTTTYGLPPLESFSFQNILASIDPEIRASIDTIAEICGRSKMSLADEYQSHLPPQGQLVTNASSERGPPSEAVAVQPRLEPVEEGSRTAGHRQRHSFALASTSSSQPPRGLSSQPVATTSNITSHHPRSSSHIQTNRSRLSASYSDQILAWLRGSTSRIDSGAADLLKGILGDKHAATPSS